MATSVSKERMEQLRARVKNMTPEETMNLLKGLGGLLYEDEPGTPEEKALKLLNRIREERCPRKK